MSFDVVGSRIVSILQWSELTQRQFLDFGRRSEFALLVAVVPKAVQAWLFAAPSLSIAQPLRSPGLAQAHLSQMRTTCRP